MATTVRRRQAPLRQEAPPARGGHRRARAGSSHVHAASLHDRDGGGQELLSEELKKELPRLELVWAEGAYTSEFRRWAEEERGWHVEVPYLIRIGSSGATGWRKSRAGSGRCPEEVGGREDLRVARHKARRLAKDYERLPESGVAMIYWAMSRIMLRRLACATC